LAAEQLVNHDPSKARQRSPGKSNNWFARVFQFKPATRVVALNTSKIKGRKEVYKMLREWKQYGIEDIRLDKANNIIYGRVGESNCTYFPFSSPKLFGLPELSERPC
jgi:glycosidase